MKTLFSIWLQEQRAKLGLTMESLAERAGCPVDLLLAIEKSAVLPSKELAGSFAQVFDVPEAERPAFILFASSDLHEDFDRDSPDFDVGDSPWEHHEEPPNNIHTQLTSFIGRVGEVDRIVELLGRPDLRLLTIAGPPGIGKTRLSLQVAARLLDAKDFDDGIFFVPLAPVSDPLLVAHTIAQTLNLKVAAGQAPLDALEGFLRDKKTLLVLDNFEQIVPGGPALGELLVACEGLKALVTSRAPLYIYGEHVYRVPTLELPDKDAKPTAGSLAQWEATELFVQRAVAVRPDFAVDDNNAQAVTEICRMLNGLPLAIELAAARAKILSPPGILSRLNHRLVLLTGGPRNLPPRQQTLRGAIDWSYDLLDEDERVLFCLLSVFVGGCTLNAAEAIANYRSRPGASDGIVTGRHSNSRAKAGRSALDVVSSLLDKSLLQQMEGANEEPRFMMLETIREYGLERLAESGEEDEARLAHALYMLQLAEQSEPHLTSASRGPWLARLDADLDNLRAALSWSQTAAGDPDLGLRLAGALHWYWYFRGQLTEGRKWLEEALARPYAGQKMQTRAKALYAAGHLTSTVGDKTMAAGLLEECVSLALTVSDGRILGYALATLGIVQVTEGTIPDGFLYKKSVDLFRGTDDKWGLAYALGELADAEYVSGNYDAGDQYYFESLSIFRELGDVWGISSALAEVGREALRRGDLERAGSLLEEALALERLEGDKRSIAHTSRSLGMIAHQRGDHLRASQLYEESRALYKEVGALQHLAAALRSLAELIQYQDDYLGALNLYQESIGIPIKSGDTRVIGMCCAGLGRIASIHGEWTLAVELFSGADSLARKALEQMKLLLGYLEYERYFADARANLSEEAFTQAWAAGEKMTQQQLDTRVQQLFIVARSKQPNKILVASSSTAKRTTSKTHYPADLTRREVEILQLMVIGLSNADIASRLFLSSNTVRSHLYSIYLKIGVNSRTAAAHFASLHNLV